MTSDTLTLERVIWVSARPPVPPFSGVTLKTLTGLDAVSEIAEVEVVAVVSGGDRTIIEKEFKAFWGTKRVTLHAVGHDRAVSAREALLARRFRLGMQMEDSSLTSVLTQLNWRKRTSLLIFDDIIFAPLLTQFGRNAILSPHDCISRMHLSHLDRMASPRRNLEHLARWWLARQYEERYYQLALLVHVVTHRDRVWLEERNSEARYCVVANADLCNPWAGSFREPAWDVVVWGNLEVGSVARGAREFLKHFDRDVDGGGKYRVCVVGGTSRERARHVLGDRRLERVVYSSQLEDEEGIVRTGRVIVVPDQGGAGTKNRSVNVLASGRCLACLYFQMEGVERACDVGAINAAEMPALAAAVRRALREGTWNATGEAGRRVFEREYGIRRVREKWQGMIGRALAIRGQEL